MFEVWVVLLVVLMVMIFIIGMLVESVSKLKNQLANMSNRCDVWENRSNDWEVKCTRTQMLTSVFEEKLTEYTGKQLISEIREKHLDRLRWMRDNGYIA